MEKLKRVHVYPYLTSEQIDWLKKHKEVTGENTSALIRRLIDKEIKLESRRQKD